LPKIKENRANTRLLTLKCAEVTLVINKRRKKRIVGEKIK